MKPWESPMRKAHLDRQLRRRRMELPGTRAKKSLPGVVSQRRCDLDERGKMSWIPYNLLIDAAFARTGNPVYGLG